MSDAETLRRAAKLMRERVLVTAQTYEPVPARVDIDREGTCDACAENKQLVASYPEPNNEPWLCAECSAQADYEASWHPAVALAVADLLDDGATYLDFMAREHPDEPRGEYGQYFLAVARAYLRATP